MNNYKIYIMKHDRASRALAEKLKSFNPEIIDLPICDLREKEKVDEFIKQAWKGQVLDKTPLIIYGSGRKHHYTYGLCKNVTDKLSNRYSYIHMDYHTDMGSTSAPAINQKYIYCGDFVSQILLDTNARNSIHIGQEAVYYRDNKYSVPRPKLKDLFFEFKIKNSKRILKSLKNIFPRIKKEAYISLDLDVLKDSINTDFGNGYLSLDEILNLLSEIKSQRKIVGMDICGLGEDAEIDKRSIQTHKDLLACILS